MSTITVEITLFAQRVRDALSDLPADEVDDLVDGLEADLAEAYAEDLQRELPDPTAYAEELRNAAGLPARESAPKTGIRQSIRGIGVGIGVNAAALNANLRRSSALAALLDFLAALRPFWWLLRGWIAYQVVVLFFGFRGPVLPYDLRGWVILGVFLTISAQWGRGQWRPWRWLTGLVVIGNVFAAAVLLPVLSSSSAWSSPYKDYAQSPGSSSYEPAPVQGLAVDGQPVDNVFAFDAAGKPLRNVQLFDQKGRPMALAESVLGAECDVPCAVHYVKMPSILANGRTAWNVFPMQRVNADETVFDGVTGLNKPAPGAMLEDAMEPFVRVSAVLAPPKAATTGKVAKGNR